MKLDELKQFASERGLSAQEIAELSPFEAYITKIYRDKAKQSDRLDIIFELVIPKVGNKIAKIRYTPLHAADLVKFCERENIQSLSELIGSALIQFEARQYGIGHIRPIPVKIVKKGFT